MNENDNAYYNYENKNNSLVKIIIIIIAVIALIIVFALLIKPKNNSNNYYNTLVDDAKIYLSNNKEKYPATIGECKEIKLNEISSSDKNIKKECNSEKTLVKVCMTSKDTYQYTPVLSCSNIETQFGDWVIGENFKQNNSDIEIKFIPEALKNGVKTYYELEEKTSVPAYYNKSPKQEYIYIEKPTIAYQWYKENTGKIYYKNGEHTTEAPKEYTMKEDKTTKEFASLTKPTGKDESLIKEGTIYAVEYVAYPYKYECMDPNYTGIVISTTLCEQRDTNNFNKTHKVHYTCDGIVDVEKETICKPINEWTTKSCESEELVGKGTTKEGYTYKRQLLTGYTCVETKGYIVTEEAWKWYYEGKNKIYYPSNEINKKTKAFFTTVPSAGYIKDETTTTYAYKYYSFKESSKEKEEWISLSNKSITEKEMIELFKKEGYEVNNLKDIEKNEKIKYEIEFSYRDRK